MEKQSQQTQSRDQSGELDGMEGLVPAGKAELRNEGEVHEKQNPFYEGVVGQPLPNEGEVSRLLQNL